MWMTPFLVYAIFCVLGIGHPSLSLYFGEGLKKKLPCNLLQFTKEDTPVGAHCLITFVPHLVPLLTA